MKRSLIITLILLLFLNPNGYSQEPTDEPITIDENTLIKDESGNKIDVLKLMELLDSAEWSMDPVRDKDGNLLYMQMRKATEEERKEMGLTSMLPDSTDIIGKPAPNFKMTDLNGNEISYFYILVLSL